MTIRSTLFPTLRGTLRPSLGFGAGGLGYPIDGRVLDLSKFTFNSVEVPDVSGEDNEAILYSGRAVSTNGVSDIINLDGFYPYPKDNVRLRFKARAPAGTLLECSVGSSTQTLDNLWEEHEFTYTDIGDPLTIAGGIGWSAAEWADIRATEANTGELLGRWLFNEYTDPSAGGLDGRICFDSSGNGNHGVYEGCAAVVQEGVDAGGLAPPQVLGMDYNQYRTGKDFNSLVEFDTLRNVASAGGSVSFQYLGAEVSTEDLIQRNNANRVRRLNGKLSVNIDATGYTFSSLKDIEYGDYVEVSRDGSDITGTINGASQTISGATVSNLSLSRLGGNLTTQAEPSLANVTFNGALSYYGYGRDPWKALDGSNNGTESGTFENTLVPAYNGTTDALGNAIVNPRGSKTFNADGSGYGLVPDADSLDLTTEATWVLRGNFYGTVSENRTFISKYETSGDQRSWVFLKDQLNSAGEITYRLGNDGLTPSKITLSGFPDSVVTFVAKLSGGTLYYYIDNVLVGSVGGFVGSIFNSTAPILVGAILISGTPSQIGTYPIDLVKIYDRALTDEEIQNAIWK